jgi:hypothetical protein
VKRRRFLAGTGVVLPSVAGCTSVVTRSPTETPSGAASPSPTATASPTPTPETKSGTVDNHRTTAVEALSHGAVRRSTGGGHEWVVRVTLRVEPQDTESATAYPIGVFFLFFDAGGDRLYRAYENVPANTGASSRTVTLSAVFRPSEASTGTFDSYRIDIVHG